MRRLGMIAAVVAATTVAVTGCSSSKQATPLQPDLPVAVALDEGTTPAPVTLGVIVSLTSAPGQGSEWVGNAEGAQVAAFRYQLAGRSVALKVVDDHGTSRGAVSAVRALVRDGVSGIVAATAGSHLRAALAAAAAAKTAVIMPYGPVPGSAATTWTTAPTAGGIAAGLSKAESKLGVSKVYTLSGHGAGAVKAAVAAARAQRADAILVDGTARTEARVVAALQGAAVSLPLLLGPAALSPTFASQLSSSGVTAGVLVTAGADATDATAAGGSAHQEVAAAFFQALRMAAQDPSVHDFFAGQSFARHAGSADIASHDAVVALADAAQKAGAKDPAAVLAALRGSKLTSADGLAGPDLDFTTPDALPADEVVPLQATSLDPGVRGDLSSGEKLFWFSILSDDTPSASADASPGA